MSEKSNMYEFVGRTINPLEGECIHRCPYCYVERLKDRFPAMKKKYSGNPRLSPSFKSRISKENEIIFVVSCGDLFADNVPSDVIKAILKKLSAEKGTLLFQTKNPGRYMEFYDIISEGSILVTTIESYNWHEQMGNAPHPITRAQELRRLKPVSYPMADSIRLQVTIEPVLDFDDPTFFAELIKSISPVQVNIGADSGRNNLPEPPPEKIKALIAELEKFTVVVKKKNLKRLLPDE